jgi:nicotinamide mononucleotide transporter
MPYIDSFTTWGSVITTFMVARKVLENWLYWIVINSVAIFLYIDRDLYQTAGLYGLYIILSVIGFIAWRKAYFEQSPEPS